MRRLTLRYREDPATGLPWLDAPDDVLSAAELEAVRRAVARQFERLAVGPDGQFLDLDGEDGPGLPLRFRVTVSEREKRFPTLTLEANEPAPSGPPGAGRWQAGFVAAAADMLAGLGEGEGRSALDFVLGDLRALLRKAPSRLTLLLFAGYLHVGAALGRRHGAAGDERYVRAAADLARRAGADLPDGALDPLLAAPEEGPGQRPGRRRGGWLRRFFSWS
jgi:hypothetical protein